MPTVVGVRFKPVTKIYHFAPLADEPLQVKDPVIVETSRGQELGWVAAEAHDVPKKKVKGELKAIVRKATPLDLMTLESYRIQEEAAFKKCQAKASELGLQMKIIQAEYAYDGSRLLISFAAEQRVDFRELVRYLVRSFRTRVEMRQIGARDEAKLIDGYGRCGRRLCCSSWLTEFHPVSIRMAKNQRLPLAPTEISGICGRLLCCLAYENDMYTDMRKQLPKVGTFVEWEAGKGKVKGLNIIKESLIVETEEGNRVEVAVSELGGKEETAATPPAPETPPTPKTPPAEAKPSPRLKTPPAEAKSSPKPKKSRRRRRRRR